MPNRLVAAAVVFALSPVLVAAESRIAQLGDEQRIEPRVVAIHELRFHVESVPDHLLQVWGYIDAETIYGSPYLYSSQTNAKMQNMAEALPLIFPGKDASGNGSCTSGYMHIIGYYNRQYEKFVVFVVIPYDEDWQPSESCWRTSIDWENDSQYQYLLRSTDN